MLGAVAQTLAEGAILYRSGSPTIGLPEFSFVTGSSTPTSSVDAGRYGLTADFSALVEGDLYEIRVYEKGAVTGGKRLLRIWPIAGPVPKPVLCAVARLGNGWDWVVAKVLGADHTVPYSLWVDNLTAEAALVGTTTLWSTMAGSYEALIELTTEMTGSYEGIGATAPSPIPIEVGARRRRRPFWQNR